ncbi:MAG: carboxypeptidase regulatory-like domain-containing protein [Chitinispirillaceae bacterium]|nr:carboxypeptidase regulatory-like domain-containing protein [Chitinispirillaceae bacterium]
MVKNLNGVLLIIGVCCGMLRAATISGFVIDSTTEDKLENVVVQLQSGRRTIAADTTDEEGAFSFDDVESGRYSIRASKDGYTTKTIDDTVETDETELEVTILLDPIVTTTVEGTVTDSAEDTPLADAVVSLRSEGRTVATDTSDSEGKYSFEEVTTGDYTVRVSLSGYTPVSVEVTVESSEAVTVDVPLVAIPTATIKGEVTDSLTGSSLEGAVVQLRSGQRTVATDTTGTDGMFAFEDNTAGDYTIRVSADAYAAKTLPAEVTESGEVIVDVPLVALPSATIEGSVTDATTGEELDGAIVELLSGTTTVGTDTSGSDGAYSFEKVVYGTYSIRAALAGYKDQSANYTIEGFDAVTINIKLVPQTYGTIIGTVTADSSAGEPLEGVTVVLSRSGTGDALDTATTDDEGEYTFEKVGTELRYTLRASKEDYNDKSATISNKSDGSDTVDFFLVPVVKKTVTILVLNASDSSGIEAARIVIATSAGGSLIVETTDEDGSVTMEDLVEGSYTITASEAGFTPRSTRYTLDSSSSETVELYLAEAEDGTKTLTGTVSDSGSGEPLESVLVAVLISSGGGGRSSLTLAAETDEDGEYIIVGIPVTVTEVTVTANNESYLTLTQTEVAVGEEETADTTTLDLEMASEEVGVIARNATPLSGQRHDIVISPDGMIVVNNFNGSGIVHLFSLDGKLLFRSLFKGSFRATVTLPRQLRFAGKSFIARVSGFDGEVHMVKHLTLCR